jgi:glyoxylase-like metal-dependent hydrolase (beta-lactamase superfamily II)
MRGVRAAEVAGELADGMTLPFAPGWQVYHTPGHTAGHCCFYNQEQRTLITGDSVMHWFGWLTMPFAMATVDTGQNAAHVQRLAELELDLVLFGHGPPLQSEVEAQLGRLVADSGK